MYALCRRGVEGKVGRRLQIECHNEFRMLAAAQIFRKSSSRRVAPCYIVSQAQGEQRLATGQRGRIAGL
jgi:hypothetical protein